MQAFAQKGFQTISYDARGHGESSWASDTHYNLDDLSNDLIEVLQEIKAPPIVVGASMGGLTAINSVGLAGPAIMKALVLVDIVPCINPTGADNILAFLNKHTAGFNSLEQAADIISNYNPHRLRPKNPQGLMKNLRLRTDGKYVWHWDPEFFTKSDLNDVGQMQSKLNMACSAIDFPVMVVRGMHSDIVTDEGVAELHKYIPQLQVYTVQNAGHMITGDRNDIFNAGIEKFISEL